MFSTSNNTLFLLPASIASTFLGYTVEQWNSAQTLVNLERSCASAYNWFSPENLGHLCVNAKPNLTLCNLRKVVHDQYFHYFQ